jgi:hypothetical protein
MLFMALSPMSLLDQDDSIALRWTANRCYSVASTYECQFFGTMIGFPTTDIWRTIAWLVLHNRVLTADNLIKRNWPCNHFARSAYA